MRRIDESCVAADDSLKICAAIEAGSNVLVVAEQGMVGSLPEQLVERYARTFRVVLTTYKGSGKRFFVELAEQLGVPTVEPKLNRRGEVVGEKALTMEALKDAIADNVGAKTLLVLPEAKRLTTGIRYWLEDVIATGTRVVCFAAVNPSKDIFLDMLEIELELPSDLHIRLVMAAEAQRQGLALDRSRLAELQPLAGRNPMLARKVIANERLGLTQKAKPQHTQYVVIMPVVIALLMAFGVVRFVGLGTGNRGLYIVGGIALVSGMAMRQLGQVRGARKRLGQ